MIDYHFEYDFSLDNPENYSEWILHIVESEEYELGEISYIFCDDEYLHKLNVEFLDHDTLTDILTFNYNLHRQINGEIYISVERVKDNSLDYKTSFEDELRRVMIHGILHLCGYADESEAEEKQMRDKENDALNTFQLNFNS